MTIVGFRPVGLRAAAAAACGLVLALAALTGGVRAQEKTEGVQWSSLSFEDALAQAKETDQMLLVDVWSSHCGQCEEMITDVWNTPEGAKLVQGLIPLHLESGKPEARTFLSRYPVTGLPSIILLNSDGQEIDRIVGYSDKDSFLMDASTLLTGVDPLPAMEAALVKKPNSFALLLPVLEKYTYRARDADAELLLKRILDLDPENKAGQAERALGTMARYYEYFRNDELKSQAAWRTMIERFPDCSSVGAAVRATFEHARIAGQLPQWVEWICGLTGAHPKSGRLNYAAAKWANRGGLHGACLAQAARNAIAANTAPANMDSIATILEGK